MSLLDEAKREPTLEDVRDSIGKILRMIGTVNRSIDHVHKILDRELYSEIPEKEAEMAIISAEMPNLRFDMNKIAQEAISELEACLKNLDLLKSKLRVPKAGRRTDAGTNI